ncbi:hypothetical protein Nepgr_008926 [Nepenthes gracilis]|uniref:Uncharacterized protein n=1 Tax=Nepenthes gracilis TaxID=150966 RepID=A0AAD3SAG9_NEPGR|nr:hypothetical protein Nepgr_008926 [Nepenthes gracilis]
MLLKELKVRETVGVESRELIRYGQKMEDQACREEELFNLCSVAEKKKMRHLMKSRNGYVEFSTHLYIS